MKVIELTDVPDNVVSIQGEQQQAYEIPVMAEGDVEAYLGTVPEQAIPCREEQRHLYPTTQEAGMRFVGITPAGLLVRPRTCTRCGMAVRVEEWDVQHKGNKVTRCELVSAKTRYKPAEDGREYLAPKGMGRILPRVVRNVQATVLLRDLSFKKVRGDAIQAQRDVYAAERLAAANEGVAQQANTA